MVSRQETWTPYGLEAIRIQHLRRRRLLALLLLLLLLGLIWAMFVTTTDRALSISVNGRDASRTGIQLNQDDGDKNKKDHVTVALEAGKVSRADTGGEATGPSITRNAPLSFERAPPYNWNNFLLLYGPYVLLGLLAWFLAKRRGRYDELNLGVYKGIAPFEMVTASQEGMVFTRKWIKEGVFGKTREAHLPRELAAITDATIEEE